MSFRIHTKSTYQRRDVTVAKAKHPQQFSYGAVKWMLTCVALFLHIVVPTLVSQKNSSEAGRLKNVLNHKGCSDYYYSTAARPKPWSWPCSLWAFPRREKNFPRCLHSQSWGGGTSSVDLSFCSSESQDWLCLPTSSTVYSIHYRIALKNQLGKKKYVKNHNLPQHLNHYLSRSTATGKQKLLSSVRFANGQIFLPESEY